MVYYGDFATAALEDLEPAPVGRFIVGVIDRPNQFATIVGIQAFVLVEKKMNLH
jgi:hypothetical protein